jgi:hydrogenase-4 component F
MEILIILSSFLVAGLVTLLIKRRNVIETVSVIASAIAFVATILTALRVAFVGTYAPFQLFSVDALGAIMMLIIAVIGLSATVYSVKYLRRETEKNVVGFNRVRQYYVLLNLFLAAMFFAVTSNSPVFAWISIEATTLSTVFLISFYNKPASIEAAWKYLVVNSVGLLLAFFGTLLYFTSFGGLSGNLFISWDMLAKNAVHLSPMIAKIAFVFALIGYGTKVGLSPMHTWLPDAHSKAPAPISALLSGVLLNVAFVTMIRFKAITDIAVGPDFSGRLLIVFGFLSILIAALINFDQKNYKRLLAYHSIENMGIATLGFGIGGLGVLAGTLHMIYHALVKAALFLSAGTIFLKYSSTKIHNVRGTNVALPVTGALFLLGFFIITGTPPFGMFTTKVLIFSAGISAHPVITIASLFSAAILFIAFFNHATAMYFGEKPSDIPDGEGSVWLIIPPLALIAVVIVLSFYLPPFLSALINKVAAIY